MKVIMTYERFCFGPTKFYFVLRYADRYIHTHTQTQKHKTTQHKDENGTIWSLQPNVPCVVYNISVVGHIFHRDHL